jgi:hypothetical protein
MITGDFPPSSRVSGVRCSAAALATMRATIPFPVYVTGTNIRKDIIRIKEIVRTVIPLQFE